jgi:hypothetical protein
MSLFTTQFDDVQPEVLVSEGRYNLRIKSTEMKTAKSGREYMLVVLENLDEPNAQAIFHNVNGVLAQDSDTTRQTMSRLANAFFAAFGQDFKEPDMTALVGEICEALVIQEHGDDGVIRNKIKKFF